MELIKKHPLALGSLIPFILFLLIFSVSQLSSDRTQNYAHPETNPDLKPSATSGVDMPRESFVRFEQVFVNSVTREETVMGLGSGVVFKNTARGSFILTNNHVCDISLEMVIDMAAKGRVGSMKNRVKSLDGEKANVTIFKKDPKTDMCVVFAKDFFRPSVSLAPTAPKIGETIYVVGAPRGYYAPKYSTVPILQGIFSGYDAHWADSRITTAVFTIRIAPGNSGSAIFNKKGQLIGVIHSHMVIFDEISWGTTYEDTKDFIRTYVDIK